MSEDARGPVGVHHLRVRYAETDQMGVAHHGSYIPWIEEARTEWMRERGRTYRSMEEEGLSLAVIRVFVRFIKSAKYDDLMRIETWMKEQHKASITLAYRLFLAPDGPGGPCGPLLAEAETRLALLGPDRRPMRIPEDLFPPAPGSASR